MKQARSKAVNLCKLPEIVIRALVTERGPEVIWHIVC